MKQSKAILPLQIFFFQTEELIFSLLSEMKFKVITIT